MKRTLLTSLLACATMLLTPLRAAAQVAELEKFADSKKYSYAVVSKSMLSMLTKAGQLKMGDNTVNVVNILDKVKSVQVVNAEKKSARKKLQKEVKSVVRRHGYVTMSQMGSTDNQIGVYCKEGSTAGAESTAIVLVYGEDSCTVIALSGTFMQSDLEQK